MQLAKRATVGTAHELPNVNIIAKNVFSEVRRPGESICTKGREAYA